MGTPLGVFLSSFLQLCLLLFCISCMFHLSGYNLPNYNEAKRSADRIRDDEHHVRLISEHEGDLSESAHHRITSKQRKRQKVGSTLLYILSYLRNRARIKKERSACLQCCNQVFISNHIGSDIESYNALPSVSSFSNIVLSISV
uniref:Uncharacterized protein n=1 Tax=Palpitomonas bilix TaxID=652834 RepID=A0A7S3DDN8_9EUKA